MGTDGSTWSPAGGPNLARGPLRFWLPQPLSLCSSAKPPPHRLMPSESKPKRPSLRFPGFSTTPDGAALCSHLEEAGALTGGHTCHLT